MCGGSPCTETPTGGALRCRLVAPPVSLSAACVPSTPPSRDPTLRCLAATLAPPLRERTVAENRAVVEEGESGQAEVPCGPTSGLPALASSMRLSTSFCESGREIHCRNSSSSFSLDEGNRFGAPATSPSVPPRTHHTTKHPSLSPPPPQLGGDQQLSPTFRLVVNLGVRVWVPTAASHWPHPSPEVEAATPRWVAVRWPSTWRLESLGTAK